MRNKPRNTSVILGGSFFLIGLLVMLFLSSRASTPTALAFVAVPAGVTILGALLFVSGLLRRVNRRSHGMTPYLANDDDGYSSTFNTESSYSATPVSSDNSFEAGGGESGGGGASDSWDSSTSDGGGDSGSGDD